MNEEQAIYLLRIRVDRLRRLIIRSQGLNTPIVIVRKEIELIQDALNNIPGKDIPLMTQQQIDTL